MLIVEPYGDDAVMVSDLMNVDNYKVFSFDLFGNEVTMRNIMKSMSEREVTGPLDLEAITQGLSLDDLKRIANGPGDDQ